MSQFAAGQGNTLSSLAALAQRSGEGQAFNQRFAQERQLSGDLLRQRQVSNQAAGAAQDRDTRLQQLAFQQESTRMQQAVQSQRDTANANRQQAEQTTADRQRDMTNQFKIRELDRMESQLGLQQQKEQRLGQQAAVAGQAPQPGSKEFNQAQKLMVGELTDIAKALDPISGPDLDDETRLSLENRREELNNGLVNLQETTKAAAVNASRTAQVLQTQRAVTQKEAGPVLEKTLEAAGQSRVLELPIDTDSGRTDVSKLKPGKVYQTPQGPAVRLGNNQWDLVDELEGSGTPPSQPAQSSPKAPSNDFLTRGPSFGAF